jgi:sugar diacid utilization regulator
MLSSLERIAWQVNSVDDVESTMQTIVEAVTQLTPWTICWVGLSDVEGEPGSGLQFDSGFAGGSWRETLSWPLAGSPSAAAIAAGAPLVIPDVHAADEFPDLEQQGDTFGFHAALIVPLRTMDRPGTMWVCLPKAHSFTDSEVAFALSVAALAAIALNNVVLLSREREMRSTIRSRNDELRQLNNLLATRNQQLQRVAQVHEVVLRQALDTSSLDAAVDAVGRVMGIPISIIDRFGHVIASTSGSRTTPPSIESAVRQLLTGAVPLPTDRVAVWDLDERWVVAVQVQGSSGTHGYMVGLSDTNHWSESERRAFEQSSLLIALRLTEERSRIEMEVRLQRELAATVLAGGNIEGRKDLQRAASLGLNLSGTNVVMRARVDHPSTIELDDFLKESAHLAASVRRELRERGWEAVVLPERWPDFTVVIQPSATGLTKERCTQAAGHVRRALLNLARRTLSDDTRVSIGIGSVGAGSGGFRRSAAEAASALDALHASGKTGMDLHISDAGSMAALVSLGRQESRALIERYLDPLVAYDTEHNADLVATVEAFLSHTGNAQRAAEGLFVHVSTVRYRLARVEKVLDIDLDDAESRLCLQMALGLSRLARDESAP